MEYEVFTLNSGSNGNSVYIHAGDTRILIDAGICAKSLEFNLNKLGTSLSEINAVFVTHEHSDHIKGIPVITKRYSMPVHVSSLSAPYVDCFEDCKVIHMPDYKCVVGCLEVQSFITPHDSMGSIGYTVETYGKKVGIATDLGFMSDTVLERLADCNGVILESNHDIKMLMSGSYPPALKQRILSNYGHLSNASCAESAVALSENGVQRIVLAHLSEENNTPALAKITTATALAQQSMYRTSLGVASSLKPTQVL